MMILFALCSYVRDVVSVSSWLGLMVISSLPSCSAIQGVELEDISLLISADRGFSSGALCLINYSVGKTSAQLCL